MVIFVLALCPTLLRVLGVRLNDTMDLQIL